MLRQSDEEYLQKINEIHNINELIRLINSLDTDNAKEFIRHFIADEEKFLEIISHTQLIVDEFISQIANEDIQYLLVRAMISDQYINLLFHACGHTNYPYNFNTFLNELILHAEKKADYKILLVLTTERKFRELYEHKFFQSNSVSTEKNKHRSRKKVLHLFTKPFHIIPRIKSSNSETTPCFFQETNKNQLSNIFNLTETFTEATKNAEVIALSYRETVYRHNNFFSRLPKEISGKIIFEAQDKPTIISEQGATNLLSEKISQQEKIKKQSYKK